MNELKYLAHYPPNIIDQVESLIQGNKLSSFIKDRYPEEHNIRTDKSLYTFTVEIKNRYLRKSSPLSKVVFDDKINVINHALGTHTFVSRIQGNKLKSKNEVRVSTVFKKGPIDFLKMIVIHELCHLKEKEHNKAFYKLCQYIEPSYFQLEFDLRLYLTHIDLIGPLY